MTPELLNLHASRERKELIAAHRFEEARRDRGAVALRIEEIATSFPSGVEDDEWNRSAALPLGTHVMDGVESALYAVASSKKCTFGQSPEYAGIDFFITVEEAFQHFPKVKEITHLSGEVLKVVKVCSEFLPLIKSEEAEGSLLRWQEQIARLQETCNSFPMLRKD